MSVYIPGMEMPTSCAECRFYGEYCYAKGDENKGSKLPCPLIPVPEHGDLIDRDKLEKDIDKYIGGEESRSRFHHWVQVQHSVIPKSEETLPLSSRSRRRRKQNEL